MEELRSLYHHWKRRLDESITNPSMSEKALHILQVIITAIHACDYATKGKKQDVIFSYWNKDKRENMNHHVQVWGEKSNTHCKLSRTRSCGATMDCDCEVVIPKYGFVVSEYSEPSFELYALRRVKDVILQVTTTQKRQWCDYPNFCEDSTDSKERRGKCRIVLNQVSS